MSHSSRNFIIPNDVNFEKLVLITPPRTVPPLWDFDIVELANFMEFHKLNWPIKLKHHAKGIYRHGTQYNKTVEGTNTRIHLIVMNSNLSDIEYANFVMHHELAHCIQSEVWETKLGVKFDKEYKARKPVYEKQADAFAAANHEACKLIVRKEG